MSTITTGNPTPVFVHVYKMYVTIAHLFFCGIVVWHNPIYDNFQTCGWLLAGIVDDITVMSCGVLYLAMCLVKASVVSTLYLHITHTYIVHVHTCV